MIPRVDILSRFRPAVDIGAAPSSSLTHRSARVHVKPAAAAASGLPRPSNWSHHTHRFRLPACVSLCAGELPTMIDGCTTDVQLEPDWATNMLIVDRVNALTTQEQ